MELLSSLALLACPLGMALMMWFMMRGQKAAGHSQAVQPLEALRAEQLRSDAAVQRREAEVSVALDRPGRR